MNKYEEIAFKKCEKIYGSDVSRSDVQIVKKNVNNAHRCQAGYIWIMNDNSSPMYTIYRCSAGRHFCIVLKKPPKKIARKKKDKSKDKMVLTKDGRLVKAKKKTHEDNIFE